MSSSGCDGMENTPLFPVGPHSVRGEVAHPLGNDNPFESAQSHRKNSEFLLAPRARCHHPTLSHFVLCQLLIVPLSRHSRHCQRTGSS